MTCTQSRDPDQVLYICACYLPPAASSRGDKSHEFFDILKQQILHFQDKGEILICGDFNARIRNLNDNLENTEPVPQRENLDTVINSHGRQLVDFLRDCDMVTLNGRLSRDMDNFTVLSTLGRSVVDYILVQSNCFGNYSNFEVATMLDVLDELNIPTDSSVPDHSLLLWNYISKDILTEGHLVNRSQGSRTNKNQSKSFRGQQGKPVFRTNGDEKKN